ncbi:MAG: oligoendopeptidase F [Chloroflexi bacterium]|nr:oligoendopeptidase F [Chloroflexota bacterium]
MRAAALPQRSEVPVADTWDVTSIYPDDAAFDAALARIAAELPAAAAYAGRLHEGAGVLADWMSAKEALLSELAKAGTYAMGYYAVDTADQTAAARQERVAELSSQVDAALSFEEPELLAVGLPTLRSWVASEPRLAHYGHYLDELERQQSHVRSTEVEEVLGLAGSPMGTARGTHAILTDADLRFEDAVDSEGRAHSVEQGTIDALLQSPDGVLRKSAWERYADGALSVRNTLANCLATGIKQDIFIARARRYPSSLVAALDGTTVPEPVYYQTLDANVRNLPVWHRFWRLLGKLLGRRAGVWDIAAPLAPNPEIPFEQALEWICAGLAPMGEDYVKIMRCGVTEQRWVDKYPNAAKTPGAFSAGVPGTHPFILLNYMPDAAGLSTLAHELGHSMHSYLAWQTQPFIYGEYTIFAAEVASNTHQALVRDWLMRSQPSRELQIALLLETIANLHRYLFLMPTLARFELEAHQRAERGEPLTAEVLSGILAEYFAQGYSGEMEGDAERIGITWAHFPHHLYANFYVYQYATGIAAAQVLSKKLLAGEPGALERYLGFLSAGGSRYPLDALLEAGVDMRAPEPMQAAYDYLAQVITRLEELLG